MIDAEQLMSIPEIITALGITRAAVHRAINRGDLPGVTVGGRQFVQRADVAKFTPRAYAGRPGTKPRGRSKSATVQEASGVA